MRADTSSGERRPMAVSNLLDRVDELYALSLLFPQDSIYKDKLAQSLVKDAVARVMEDTRETALDYEAQRFFRAVRETSSWPTS